ncbi:MAG TPA: hypothetical protein DD407_00960 [Pseudohongiella sp.]|nr:hypothetical protein [Gammaproteobacteria bacterium]HBN13577.1 hypothetical protein [Pseudohongiella sp.]
MESRLMTWSEEQQAFWNWITRPQDLRESADDIQQLFKPHREISQVEALAIYNNAYHQRLIQISSELFPVTYHTLGQDVYTRLWIEYLASSPPRPGPMGLLGENLLAFVRQHEQFGKLPALISIIELESLLIELFDRADEPAYTQAQLQSLPPDQWPETRWQPKQDWAIMSSAFDLEQYWSQMQQYMNSADPVPGETSFSAMRFTDTDCAWYLVRRSDYRMQFHRISELMAGFLQRLQQGVNFAELCDYLNSQRPDEDIPTLSLQLLLKTIELQLLHR